MDKLIRSKHGEIDHMLLMSFLRDHVNYPNSICRHVDPADDVVHAMKTLDSMLFVPTKREAWFSKGLPCANRYYRYDLNGEFKGLETDAL